MLDLSSLLLRAVLEVQFEEETDKVVAVLALLCLLAGASGVDSIKRQWVSANGKSSVTL